MANFFDQFDPEAPAPKANFFDQFDPSAPAKAKAEPNFFDQFTEPPKSLSVSVRGAAPAPPYQARGAESSQAPLDEEAQAQEARERAALAMQRGVRAPFKEGPISAGFERAGTIPGRIASAAGGIVKEGLQTFGGMASGDIPIPQTGALPGGTGVPEESPAYNKVLDLASLAAGGTPAMGSGRAIAAAYVAGNPAAKAEHLLGVNIPKGIEGGAAQAGLSQVLSRVPFAGTPLRRAGQEAVEQLGAAGERGAAMPAGRAVIPEEGGDVLRLAISNAFGAGQLLPSGHGGKMAARLAGLSSEGAMDTYINLAKGKAADRKAFADIRAAVHFTRGGVKDWETIQGGMLARLGQGADGAFDPKVFTKAWSALPAQGKAVAFESRELTRHLDTIAEVSNKYGRRLEGLSGRGAGPGRAAMIGGALGSAVFHPVSFLSAFVAPRALSAALARPSSAASVAQWTRSYDKLLNHPSPGAVAAFSLAAQNLRNNLEADFDPRDMIIKLKESLPEVKLDLGLPSKE